MKFFLDKQGQFVPPTRHLSFYSLLIAPLLSSAQYDHCVLLMLLLSLWQTCAYDMLMNLVISRYIELT